MNVGWHVENIPDQTGRTVVVTGANSGLGLETAKALAGAGADMVLACRNMEKGEAAVDQIRRETPQAHLELMTLDLADLRSVASFAQTFKQSRSRLDSLINNAGVMALPERRTVDRFEMQFGVNHLGHFALTGQLLDQLMATPESRVVTVSSLAHKFGRLNFKDLNWEDRHYNKWLAYCQSKLANLVFALELERKLQKADADVSSVAAHPGLAATNLQMVGPKMSGSKLGALNMKATNLLLSQTQADGALPSLYAAAAPGVYGGEYFGPGGFAEMRGTPVKVDPAPRAKQEHPARELWRASEKLTGIKYPV